MPKKTFVRAIHFSHTQSDDYKINVWREELPDTRPSTYDQDRRHTYTRSAREASRLVNTLEKQDMEVMVFPEPWALWVAYVRPLPKGEEVEAYLSKLPV